MTEPNQQISGVIRQMVRRAQEEPNGLALAFPAVFPGHADLEVTWSELEASVSHAGSMMKTAGVKPGQIILILTKETHEQIFAFLGAIAVGALPSILSYPSIKQSEAMFLRTLQPILEKTKGEFIVCSDQYLEMVRQFPINRLPCTGRHRERTDLSFSSAGEDCFLQFSSGTTGLRKGIVVTERMLEDQMKSFGLALELKPSDRAISWVPLYHDMGLVGSFLLPLFHGFTSIHIPTFPWLQRPLSLFEAVAKYSATFMWLPNFALSFLVNKLPRTEELVAANISLKTLRLVINASEPVRPSTNEKFLSRFRPLGLDPAALRVCYGMAEDTLIATATPIAQPIRLDQVDREAFMARHVCVKPTISGVATLTFVSCGVPLSNTKVRIAGQSEERRVGEIEIKSGSLFSGYWTSEGPKSDAGCFTEDGWYRSGDLGYLAEGELFVTGRSKDLIISRGANIYPHDIEDTICQVPGVRPGRAVAFGIFDEGIGTEQVFAMCELRSEADALSVRDQIREEVLATHGVRLEEVMVVEPGTLRKSTSGKLSRSANRELFLERAGSSKNGTSAVDDREINLSAYYQLVDGIELMGGWLAKHAWSPFFDRFRPLAVWLRSRLWVYASPRNEEPWLKIRPSDFILIQDFANPRVPAEYVQQTARSADEARRISEILRTAIQVGVLAWVGPPAEDFDAGQTFVTVKCPESDHLVFFFKGGSADAVDFVPAVEFARSTGLIHHNLVMFRDPTRTFYQRGISLEIPTIDQLLAWQRGYQAAIGAKHIYCCGTSMGAYAAIQYGHRIRAKKVWAFSPVEWNEAPRLAEILAQGNGVTEYDIWYGDRNVQDRDLAESLRGLAGVRLHPVAHDSHLIANVLWNEKKLPLLLPAPDAAAARSPRSGEAPTLEEICRLVATLAPSSNGSLHGDTPLGGVLDSFETFQLLSLLEQNYRIRLDPTRMDNQALSTPQSILRTVLERFNDRVPS